MIDTLPNKVTSEALDEIIESSSVAYTTFGTLTYCVITLPCGFTATGESACVDPKNFDAALGEKYALEKVKAKLWELEGYLLANDRYRARESKAAAPVKPKQLNMTRPLQRMIIERAELTERLDKLTAFLAKDKPVFVEWSQWVLMTDQKIAMDAYHAVLSARIELMSSKDNNHE